MISTHILDTSKGNPAEGVPVVLEVQSGDSWRELAAGLTNSDGRLVFDCERASGTYRLIFQVEEYFHKHAVEFFFPVVPVTFVITNTGRKYHVPLLLNPYGYSTYRGS